MCIYIYIFYLYIYIYCICICTVYIYIYILSLVCIYTYIYIYIYDKNRNDNDNTMACGRGRSDEAALPRAVRDSESTASSLKCSADLLMILCLSPRQGSTHPTLLAGAEKFSRGPDVWGGSSSDASKISDFLIRDIVARPAFLRRVQDRQE